MLLETRNGIVHAGMNARGQADSVLAETARYIEYLLPSVGLTRLEYWGELEEMVRAYTERRLTAVEGAYERKLQAARVRFAALARTLEDEGLEAWRATVEPGGHSNEYTSFPVDCLACASTGSVFGSPRPEWEADWDVADGMAYAAGAYVDSIALDSPAFECRVCNLFLPSTMFELAGLEAVFSHRDAFDTSEASWHFTQQLADDYWDG